jgi:UrcA family protein
MTRFFSATHLIAIALIAGAFGLGFFSGPALAEEQVVPDQDFNFSFYYTPDELGSTPKAEKLLTRLEHAVRRECGANLRMTLSERTSAQACITKTMSASVARFGSEAVAQAYKSRTVG